MRRLGVAAACLVLSASTAPSWAQGVDLVDGGYSAGPLTLSGGQTAPLQLDRSGNLLVDCVTGCASASGSGSSQGAPNTVGNAWPMYLSVGGSPISSSSGLPVTDTANGSAVVAAVMPNGGVGSLGWLSAIETQLASGTITIVPASGATFSVTDSNDGTATSTAQMSSNGVGILGWLSTIVVKLANTLNVSQVSNGTVTDGSVSIGTASTLAVAAAAGARYRATLTNTSTVSGNTVWCRSDGGAASVGVGVQLPANGGGYEWDFPLTGAKPAAAINCLASSQSASVALEYVQ